jgi:lipoprotein-anchoring transpeptidase ErfK/SrfK
MPSLHRHCLALTALAGAAVSLAGCGGAETPQLALASPPPVATKAVAPAAYDPKYSALYQPIGTDKFPVPGVPRAVVREGFERKEVAYTSREPAGTIVVDPHAHYLYYIEPNGMAMRYGVGVGKQGFGWSGEAIIKTKQEWPDWYPPKEMIDRHPELKPQLDKLQSGEGVPGGYRNPLGARAMYLWQGNKDTYYRIHGTLEPHSIGTNASSGCIRMINQDAIDLYSRVSEGTRVVVLGSDHPTIGVKTSS